MLFDKSLPQKLLLHLLHKHLPLAQMHYCDHALSVVRLSVVNFSYFGLLLLQVARSQCP